MKQTVTLELEIPEGYEVTGDFHQASNEWYLDTFTAPPHAEYVEGSTVTDSDVFILRKLPSVTVTVELPRETINTYLQRHGQTERVAPVENPDPARDYTAVMFQVFTAAIEAESS